MLSQVKMTIEGHEFEPLIVSQLHISFTPGRIFIKFWSNFGLLRRCAEPMTQHVGSRSMFQLKVTSLNGWVDGLVFYILLTISQSL